MRLEGACAYCSSSFGLLHTEDAIYFYAYCLDANRIWNNNIIILFLLQNKTKQNKTVSHYQKHIFKDEQEHQLLREEPERNIEEHSP